MTATRHTLTGNILSQLGALDYRRVTAWLETNADDQVVYDTSAGGAVHVGRIPVSISNAGTFSVSVIDTSGTTTLPSVFQYRLIVQYVNEGPDAKLTIWSSPWFSVTANVDLKDLGEDYAPAQWLTELTTSLQSYAAAASASADRAEAAGSANITDLGTSDGQAQALIQNSSSLTRAALTALYARKASAETISGAWNFTTAPTVNGGAIGGGTPTDSDLTAIAALSTTAYGRSLLELSDEAAGRTALGAAAASHTHVTDNLPASVMLTATYAGGTAVRPSSTSSVRVFWVCTTAVTPPVVISGTAGRYDGDIVSVVA